MLAVDGYDVHGPTPVTGQAVRLTAGGRVDLEVTAPAAGRARWRRVALVLGSGCRPTRDAAAGAVDLLHYGTPAPIGFDAGKADRRFDYSVGRRPGFLDGRPGLWWSINGHLFPDVPMFVVEEGDVVRMRIENHSRAGAPDAPARPPRGGPVPGRRSRRPAARGGSTRSTSASGQSYDIAFVADNPGIWMDHCHNLPHAAQGLVAHLMYAGLTSPFRVGGPKANEPE